MRRSSLEEEYNSHVPELAKNMYKDIRGHPDGIETSRSNTQTSEQKESGYFSNPRSTSSKNHGMQLPSSNRAVTASERKLTSVLAGAGNRRQTYTHIDATKAIEDDDEGRPGIFVLEF